MSEEVMNNKDNKSNLIYTSIIVLLSLVIVFISYLYFNQIKETDKKIEEVVKTTSEKESVKAELNSLLVQYDSLMTDNDSINYMLEEQQIKIMGYIKEIDSGKSKIRSYKKELSTLRNIMKSYVVQIDSLNTRNKILIEENKNVTEKYLNEKEAKHVLAEKTQNLEEKVQIASTLKAEDVVIEVFKKRHRKTRIAKKVQKIKICFVIPDNSIVESKSINVYVRIARPDELIIAESEYNLFDFEGKEIVYSATRIVEYDNTKLNEACIFVDNNESLIPGTYNIDIFTNGKLIGNGSFSLK